MTLTEFCKAIVEGKPLVHRLTTTDPWVERDPRSYLSAIILADWKVKDEPPVEKTLGQIAYEAYYDAQEKLTRDRWDAVAAAVAENLAIVALRNAPKINPDEWNMP